MNHSTITVDTIIDAKWLIPVEPYETVLNQHAIVIDKGGIVDILPSSAARLRYHSEEIITLDHHVVIPGLINLHTHAAMTLMRGFADDLPLIDWLNKQIWPIEQKFVDPQFVFDGAQIACAEMIASGITCFNDMYFFPESCAEAVVNSGMRAVIGMIVVDSATAYATDYEDYLVKGLKTRDHYQQHPLISFCLAPHAPYTVSDSTLRNILTYAEQINVPIHMHIHESASEIKMSLESTGMRPIERLRQLDLLGPNLVAVHMVRLTDHEIKMMHQYGCHVAHCPSSNMKFANGIAPVTALVEQEINVGIGTDSAASNNRLDILSEMRQTALLAKLGSGKADALSAHCILKMATLNSAKALGLEKTIGSLSIGKAADITAIDFSDLQLQPCYDPVSHLIYVAGRDHVSHVWVNGKMLLNNKQLTTVDTHDLRHRAHFWQERITATLKH